MNVQKAYIKVCQAWGVEKMPCLSDIRVSILDKSRSSFVMQAAWRYDSENNPYNYEIRVDHLYFKALWKALRERLPEDKANKVFDTEVERITCHEMAHICEMFHLPYRNLRCASHGRVFKFLMYHAGYPGETGTVRNHKEYVPGTLVSWDRVSYLRDHI